MSRNTFASLLKKYQSGHASHEEKQVVEQWYALLEEEPRALSSMEWETLEKRLWQKLQKSAFENERPIVPEVISVWQRSWFKVAAAASVLILITFGLVLKYNVRRPNVIAENDQTKRVINKLTAVMIFTLEDSSKVWLNPGGVLRFPDHFAAGKREVFLTGEAFFEVSENPDRPFLVNAGQITTKVLGTSFRIKAPYEGSEVEVSVKTGKVSVYEKDKEDTAHSNKHGNGVILNPNHQVTFLTKNKTFVTRLVDQPSPLPKTSSPDPNLFEYNDTPLIRVIEQLEQTYSIDVEVERKALGDCPLTANLAKKGLYAQLDLLCAAIQGTYEVKGTTILISGRGCE